MVLLPVVTREEKDTHVFVPVAENTIFQNTITQKSKVATRVKAFVWTAGVNNNK